MKVDFNIPLITNYAVNVMKSFVHFNLFGTRANEK